MDDIKAIDINNWPTQIEGLNYDYNKYQEWRQMAATTFKPFFPTGRFPFTPEERKEFLARMPFMAGTVFCPYESTAALVQAMDKVGYDIVCLCALRMWSYRNTYELIVDYKEDFIYDRMKEAPGRIIGVAGYSPNHIPESIDWIRNAVQNWGFQMVFAHPITFGLAVNDKKMYPLYGLCNELKIAVSMQVGHSAEPLPSWVGHPMLIDEVVMDFPDLKINLSHTGYPWRTEWADMLWKHPNVYGDIAAYMPSGLDKETLDFINSGVGREKVMWGSNGFGLARGKMEIMKMEGWKPQTKANLLRNNAIKFLGLDLPLYKPPKEAK
ncbi:Amidohydrolase family protein [uncultured Desulfobacterium sp.]|uniref:Amidohydrolase family protein n=1 Tax=uncultured Desulfobacterium sp. TaxID=201089 RepID=A0A445MRS6_9BACT|nr:Amidohydrolase family protein [uncultured Desulfobacterium sp.]